MSGADHATPGQGFSQIEIVFPPLYAIIDAVLVKTSELSFAEMMAESGVEILQSLQRHGARAHTGLLDLRLLRLLNRSIEAGE